MKIDVECTCGSKGFGYVKTDNEAYLICDSCHSLYEMTIKKKDIKWTDSKSIKLAKFDITLDKES
jgi:ribosomal protein L24E